MHYGGERIRGRPFQGVRFGDAETLFPKIRKIHRGAKGPRKKSSRHPKVLVSRKEEIPVLRNTGAGAGVLSEKNIPGPAKIRQLKIGYFQKAGYQRLTPPGGKTKASQWGQKHEV